MIDRDAALSDPVQGEILSPASSQPNVTTARALVGRLVRGGDISPDLLPLVDGPLADAVSKAADYAGKAIAPGTVETYKGDWATSPAGRGRTGSIRRCCRSTLWWSRPGWRSWRRRWAPARCAGGWRRSPGITAASGTPGRLGTRRSGRP